MRFSCHVETRNLPSGALEITLESDTTQKRVIEVLVIDDLLVAEIIRKSFERFELSKDGALR